MIEQCCKKFVSIFSVDEFILEHENKNNITFKWKFLSNFMLFGGLFVRKKFAYQILSILNARNISSWDISQRRRYFILLFTRRYVRESWCFSTCTCALFHEEKTNNFLLLFGPQLHLRTFQGITMTSKCPPVDPISMSDVSSTKILSVEIRMMTVIIPPSAFVDLSTRTIPKIVVLIFGGKLHFTVKWQKMHSKERRTGAELISPTFRQCSL